MPGGKGGEAGRGPPAPVLSRGCGLRLGPGAGSRAALQRRGESGTGLLHRVRVPPAAAAPGASLAWPCSAVCRSCVARSTGCKCYVALQRWVQVLHGPAATHASLAWMALQHRSQVLHGSAAPAVGPALPCSAVCRSCMAHGTGCKCFVALQRCLRVLCGPAVLAAGPAWPHNSGC